MIAYSIKYDQTIRYICGGNLLITSLILKDRDEIIENFANFFWTLNGSPDKNQKVKENQQIMLNMLKVKQNVLLRKHFINNKLNECEHIYPLFSEYFDFASKEYEELTNYELFTQYAKHYLDLQIKILTSVNTQKINMVNMSLFPFSFLLTDTSKESTFFTVSKNIMDYSDVLTELKEDFGTEHYPAILNWCDVIKRNDNFFWKVWLIEKLSISFDRYQIGICGLYSIKENTKDVWLGWFGLFKSYRGYGHGKDALQFMQNEAVLNSFKTMYVYVDEKKASINFYKKYGFKELCSVKDYLNNNPTEEEWFSSLTNIILYKDLGGQYDLS